MSLQSQNLRRWVSADQHRLLLIKTDSFCRRPRERRWLDMSRDLVHPSLSIRKLNIRIFVRRRLKAKTAQRKSLSARARPVVLSEMRASSADGFAARFRSSASSARCGGGCGAHDVRASHLD